MELSPRLKAVASYALNAPSVADIGTDHGYIPVYLAEHGAAGRIVAADINEGPLHRAKLSAREAGVEERLEFHLTDGLVGIDPVDTVLIAGMGGDTMMGILKAAPWSKEGTTLVLQPQSKVPELVSWLREEGFSQIDGQLVYDAGKMYNVMVFTHTGIEGALNTAGLYGLESMIEHRDPLLPEHLQNLVKRQERVVEGVSASDRDRDRAEAETALLNELKRLYMEVSQW